MALMATWMDGPEYAPLERPTGFVDVPHPQLPDADPPPAAPDPAPAAQPAFSPPAKSTDLATIGPPQADLRDPHAPFEVTVAAVTSWSGKPGEGGEGTEWTPDQPLAPASDPQLVTLPPPLGMPVLPTAQAQPYPAPGTPAWFGPSHEQPQPTSHAVSLRNLVDAVTVPALILLLLGVFIHSLSLLLLVVGLVAANRIAYRRQQVTVVVGLTVGAILLVAVVLIAGGADIYSFFEDVSTTAQVLSAGALIALIVICQRALAHREPRRPR